MTTPFDDFESFDHLRNFDHSVIDELQAMLEKQGATTDLSGTSLREHGATAWAILRETMMRPFWLIRPRAGV